MCRGREDNGQSRRVCICRAGDDVGLVGCYVVELGEGGVGTGTGTGTGTGREKGGEWKEVVE